MFQTCISACLKTTGPKCITTRAVMSFSKDTPGWYYQCGGSGACHTGFQGSMSAMVFSNCTNGCGISSGGY